MPFRINASHPFVRTSSATQQQPQLNEEKTNEFDFSSPSSVTPSQKPIQKKGHAIRPTSSGRSDYY